MLAPALGGAVALQELWLGGNPLGDVGVAALAPLLGGMRELAELWLCGVSLHDEGACALADALAQYGCPRMRWLMLNTNSIADAGAVALAQAATPHPRTPAPSLHGRAGAMRPSPALQTPPLEPRMCACAGAAEIARARAALAAV